MQFKSRLANVVTLFLGFGLKLNLRHFALDLILEHDLRFGNISSFGTQDLFFS